MNKAKSPRLIPRCRGRRWIDVEVPGEVARWEEGRRASLGKERTDHRSLEQALRSSLSRSQWHWPRQPVYFFADPHADADAFVASLAIAGLVKKTGPRGTDFQLTKAGREGLIIVGGDCLDKGPSSLALLDALKHLMDSKARVILLAGNHDLRLLMGVGILDRSRDPRTEHFFLRMGPKIVPLLREVSDTYLRHRGALSGVPDARDCRRRLYPASQWFKEFPVLARWVMPDEAVQRELERMEKKWGRFEKVCLNQGLSMRRVFAAAHKCRELFLEPGGRYHWFFHGMRLAHREGSFLFVHAGVDDRLSALLERNGLDHVNRQYQEQVVNDPFEFYYGPLANALRTKYRETDMPLTDRGVEGLRRLGIHTVVHGHRNRLKGQRIMLRRGLMHLECDTTLDRNSRRQEGLKGLGAGVTIIHPQGKVIGISNDFPQIKLFDPAHPGLRWQGVEPGRTA